ncbi:cell division protein ZapE [Paeniglutamicibacter sp. MACA_103]|uniref:cell division protein ZapE n=1 Tax=Paeniglutamicibacter sp. MACA_103 TaxID=3377337 RepID=UPI003894A4D8
MPYPKSPIRGLNLSGAARHDRHAMQQAVAARAKTEHLEIDAMQLESIDLLTGNAAAHLAPRHRSPGKKHVYLWGPPGRGKTWILGAFFDALPTERKLRVHFHDFFRDLHATAHKATTLALAQIDEPDSRGDAQGRADRVEARTSAIEQSIETMLGDVEVLCFDEFHCNDPGDAMLLARTVKYVIDRDILLVTTSNYPPEELLSDEYYHHLVLPTIATIREHMTVHELDAHRDYRSIEREAGQRSGFSSGTLLSSPDPGELQRLGLTAPHAADAVRLTPTSHEIQALRISGRQIWFGFADLCEALTSTLDYLALAREHDHWIISGVPGSGRMTPFGLRRLANVIDVLYDHQVRLDLFVEDGFTDSFDHLPELEAARLRSRINALDSGTAPTAARTTSLEGMHA